MLDAPQQLLFVELYMSTFMYYFSYFIILVSQHIFYKCYIKCTVNKYVAWCYDHINNYIDKSCTLNFHSCVFNIPI